jgi:hypothetical protein
LRQKQKSRDSLAVSRAFRNFGCVTQLFRPKSPTRTTRHTAATTELNFHTGNDSGGVREKQISLLLGDVKPLER